MRRALCLLAVLLGTHVFSSAATHTFIAADGRSLEAEILGYRGETLRIRRADTGREFKLPLSSLAPASQTETRALLRTNPQLRDSILPDAVRVEFSRSRFETDRTKQSYYDVNIQQWGYTITVTNLTSEPIEGLRLEHIVFAELDPDHARGKPESKNLESVRGTSALEAIPPRGRVAQRTKAVSTRTEKTVGGVSWITEDGLKKKIRDRALEGVWFRLYDGDKLIHEISSPESLRTTERWVTE